jgi:tyrosyl-tRNA synthetase
VHGPEQLEQAEAAGRALFGRDDLTALGEQTLGAALQEAGSVTVDGEVPTVAQLFQLTGLVSSLSEARRTVKEGGAYVNNERVTDADAVPGDDAWLPGGWLVLRRGKRSIAGVQRTL